MPNNGPGVHTKISNSGSQILFDNEGASFVVPGTALAVNLAKDTTGTVIKANGQLGGTVPITFGSSLIFNNPA